MSSWIVLSWEYSSISSFLIRRLKIMFFSWYLINRACFSDYFISFYCLLRRFPHLTSSIVSDFITVTRTKPSLVLHNCTLNNLINLHNSIFPIFRRWYFLFAILYSLLCNTWSLPFLGSNIQLTFTADFILFKRWTH